MDAEGDAGDQDDDAGGDAADEVGGEAADDDRGAADRRDEQLVEVAVVDLGHEREAGGRGGDGEHQRDRQLEGRVALAVEERRRAREGLGDLADVDRQEEERDEERRDRRLGVADISRTARRPSSRTSFIGAPPPPAPRSASPGLAPSSRRPVASRKTSSSEGRATEIAPTGDGRGVEPADDLGDRRGAVLDVEVRAVPSSATVRSRPARSPIACSVASASAPRSSTETTSLPISAFRSSGVPSATSLPSSMIASAVAELVGLLEVLRGEEDRGAGRR